MFSGRLQHLPEFKSKFPASTTHRLPPLKYKPRFQFFSGSHAMSSAKWSWFYTTILEYIKWFLVFFLKQKPLFTLFIVYFIWITYTYYVMSADFKLCIKCDKLVNILDDHEDCYRHRVCNSEFPCEICKSWTSEKRQSVERMIDKARLAATKKTIEIDWCWELPFKSSNGDTISSCFKPSYSGGQPKQSKSSYGDSKHPKSSYGHRGHTKSSCGDRDLPK
jgi:hypothetical protein